MTSNKENPIIIKKISVHGHGHHGGAWKVAYADFVTAMMAFFLLLWLLSAASKEQLQGLAQYFEPTIGLADQMGIGFKGGKATDNEGQKNDDKDYGVKYGVKRVGEILDVPKVGEEISVEEMENQQFQLIEGELDKIIRQDPVTGALADNIKVEQTPEGLTINIMDNDKYPMFKPGSAELTKYSENVLFKISELIRYSKNFISISGHTDRATQQDVLTQYSNWELAADRANSARKYMTKSGIPNDKVSKIVSYSDSQPIDTENPSSSKNRRIAITLLRNSVMPYYKVSAPEQLLQNP
jgi:chemotaxis protein MotB